MIKILSVTLLFGSLAVYAQTDTPAGTGVGTGTVSPTEETRGGTTETRPGTFDEEREEARTGTGAAPGTLPEADTNDMDQERQQGTDLGTEELDPMEEEERVDGLDTTTPEGTPQTDDIESL